MRQSAATGGKRPKADVLKEVKHAATLQFGLDIEGV